MRIAWFGTGMMGSGFVEAMRRRGEEVVVWNRSPEKAKALERFGALAVADAHAAARGAQRVHIMLSDDPAVDQLLDSLEGSFDSQAIVIDHSTVAPAQTARRFGRMASRGTPFLHAPVFMSPQAARDGAGVMLAAGPKDVFAKVESELAAMTGHLWYTGERTDLAAAYKLFGNEILIFIVAGLADMYGIAQSVGLGPREAFALFSHFKPGAAIDFRGKKMAEGDFRSSFDLAMARKDVRLMLETAAAAGVPLHVLPAIAARMDAVIAQGHGSEDLAVIGLDRLPENALR
ncbi:MAG: NAD(P)-dependent oxidoreductase [Vulcanimicrobiaceae bacterium]